MTRKMSTDCTHEMLTMCLLFLFINHFILIIYIVNKVVMTSRYKLSSSKVVNMTLVFKDNVHM